MHIYSTVKREVRTVIRQSQVTPLCGLAWAAEMLISLQLKVHRRARTVFGAHFAETNGSR